MSDQNDEKSSNEDVDAQTKATAKAVLQGGDFDPDMPPDQRRRVVQQFLRMGVSRFALAKMFDKSTRTIDRDIRILKKRARHKAVRFDVWQGLGDAMTTYDHVIQEAWRVIYEAEEPTERVAAMRVIVHALRSKTDLQFDAGLVPKAPNRSQIELDADIDIGHLGERELKDREVKLAKELVNLLGEEVVASILPEETVKLVDSKRVDPEPDTATEEDVSKVSQGKSPDLKL